jgi:hypothetical protein
VDAARSLEEFSSPLVVKVKRFTEQQKRVEVGQPLPKKFLRKNLICANKGRVSDPDPHGSALI